MTREQRVRRLRAAVPAAATIAARLMCAYQSVLKIFAEDDRGSPDGDGPPKPEQPQPTPITKRPRAERCAGSGGAMTRTEGGAAGGDHALNAARRTAGSEPARGHPLPEYTEGGLVRLARPPAPNGDGEDQSTGRAVGAQPAARSLPPSPSRDAEIAAYIAAGKVTRCPTKFLAPSDHAKPAERDIPAILATVPPPVSKTRAEVTADSHRRRIDAMRWRALRAREEKAERQ